MLKPLTLALLIASPAAAQRYDARAECAGTGATPDFTCTITLTQGGAPAENVAFAITPDMPGMPMAHNIAPAQAKPGDSPGRYTVPLALEMFGHWRLRLDITAPRRDLVILEKDFLPDGTCTDIGSGHDH